MHHLCLGFTCTALFLYPSCSFAVISLIVFTHNMHTLCYIGCLTWSKSWLINFWAMYFLVYAFFYVWTVENIFLKRYDNQCANIFFTHATVFGSHSAMFAFYWKKEYFFFMCILNLIFFSLVCVFLFFPTPFIFPQNCFSQNLFCFSYFYRGRNFF